MTDRVLSALRGLGIEASPLSLLEREDGFFALLSDQLIYQDEQGTRRVTLRDLTRIRSDSEGMLRVETPAGTALTANLMGFDPGQVQGFFAQVRDATARAKQLPTAPLPTGGGFKTFGSVPKDAAPKDSVPKDAAPRDIAFRESAPSEGGVQVKEVRTPTATPTASPAPSAPAPTGPTQVGTPKAEADKPTVVKLGQAKQAQDRNQDKQNRKPRLEVQTAPQDAPAATLEPGPAKVTVVSASPRPAPAPEAPDSAAPISTASLPGTAAETEAPDALPTVPPAPVEGLAARAAAVAGLPSRLQVLAVVLGLAAVGLAFFQYRGGAPLNGLWTLIAGGVGSVALFVFADVTRLIVALARETAAQTHAAQGPADDRRP